MSESTSVVDVVEHPTRDDMVRVYTEPPRPDVEPEPVKVDRLYDEYGEEAVKKAFHPFLKTKERDGDVIRLESEQAPGLVIEYEIVHKKYRSPTSEEKASGEVEPGEEVLGRETLAREGKVTYKGRGVCLSDAKRNVACRVKQRESDAKLF